MLAVHSLASAKRGSAGSRPSTPLVTTTPLPRARGKSAVPSKGSPKMLRGVVSLAALADAPVVSWFKVGIRAIGTVPLVRLLALLEKAVVAKRVEASPLGAVGAVGVPVKAGLANLANAPSTLAHHAVIACLTRWDDQALRVVSVPPSASSWVMVVAVHSRLLVNLVSLALATTLKSMFRELALGATKPDPKVSGGISAVPSKGVPSMVLGVAKR